MKNSDVVIVIPARYPAQRLPGKPLADINGKPMIQWVYERCRATRGVRQTIVATDDSRIERVVRDFGGEAMLTSPNIQSGTDRVAAVAEKVSAQIFVNVQGDEPLIQPHGIERAIALVSSGRFPIGTLMTPLKEKAELADSSVVKVISDQNGRAIYFSRHPIPYSRGPLPAGERWEELVCKRHIGLYVYDRETLLKFSGLPVGGLEKAEVLEQLRALEHGIPIGVEEVDFTSIGVDTPEDLEKVRQILV